MTDLATIVQISLWDRLQIQVSSLLLGAWVLCKRFLKNLWTSKSSTAKARGDPPQCLVDTALGAHKHKIIKEIKFHYVEAGHEAQPLMLLLHGFADCWLTWRYQIPAFAHHFHVIALDLKGFGESEKPMARISYQTGTLLDELALFIESLHASSCIIVGHDVGGLLGWFLVHHRPDLVDRFVAVSSPHPNLMWHTLPSNSLFNSHWISFAQLPHLPEMEALQNDVALIDVYHKHLLQGKTRDANDPYLEAYKYTFSRQRDWVGPINYFRNLPFARVNAKCETVPVRTLLVTGRSDPSVDLEAMVQSTDYCAKFVVKIIDGATHFPHQENADAFNREILKFLKVEEGQRGKEIRSERGESKGLMHRMFGAVSYTVKCGNSMFDSVQKRSIVARE